MSIKTHVPIQWHWIDFNPGQGGASIKYTLERIGINPALLSKAVYVIRLKSPFSIKYPKHHTPTIYIGEGRILRRLPTHGKWIDKFQRLGYAFPIEVACCFPEAEGDPSAHRVFEAHLLRQFLERYGSLPLKNKNRENIELAHEFSRTSSGEVLGPGKGAKHKWAIQPLMTNPFKEVFEKTHQKI